MAHLRFFSFIFCFASVLFLSLSSSSTATDDDRKVYVVYMGALPSHDNYMPMDHHNNMLQQVLETDEPENVVVRNFKRSFNGFVARLTDSEKDKLAEMEGVVSVFPRMKLELQTTRSWDFMGLTEKIKRDRNGESDIIIGVIDTGIWIESDSFTDKGFGPPPAKWKGACKGGRNFTCNNKIIGARYYTAKTEGSARDEEGHGSHTASTAAGNLVPDTSFFGLASGTVRGGVPSSRIAVYKTCDPSGCTNDGLLAAFDDAIADGVDIITISIGGTNPAPFQNDPISIGAFHAMARGVLTVNSAGNSGPSPKTVSSVSPWLLTVAASTTDRRFIDKVVLGNGKTLEGLSINSLDLNGTKFPLVFGKDISPRCKSTLAGSCTPSCMDPLLAKGKILICSEPLSILSRLINLGAAGYIFKDATGRNLAVSVPVSATLLAKSDFDAVVSYKTSGVNPVATILKSETVLDSKAPVVATFSSRGPNAVVPDILKPDITAPGVNILAAYSPFARATTMQGDTRHVKYNVLSGTSMSCPHVAGVAAYIKSIHPQWSPSVIKSAVMTTAWPMNTSANIDGEFAYGAGHVDPVRATNPGLVYETTKEDYISMLCAMDLTRNAIKIITGAANTTCPTGPNKLQMRDVNYPSMAAKVTSGGPFDITFHRTVTNVGAPISTYTAKVIGGTEVKVNVVPQSLSFKALNEKKSFTVTVSGKGLDGHSPMSVSLVWSDGVNIVRSPIVVYRNMLE